MNRNKWSWASRDLAEVTVNDRGRHLRRRHDADGPSAVLRSLLPLLAHISPTLFISRVYMKPSLARVVPARYCTRDLSVSAVGSFDYAHVLFVCGCADNDVYIDVNMISLSLSYTWRQKCIVSAFMDSSLAQSLAPLLLRLALRDAHARLFRMLPDTISGRGASAAHHRHQESGNGDGRGIDGVLAAENGDVGESFGSRRTGRRGVTLVEFVRGDERR